MDSYQRLGVARNAPASVIKAAYRARIRDVHPDSGGDAAEAQAVNEAWETLRDPVSRERYDRTLDTPARTPETPSRRPRSTVYRGDVDPPRPWYTNAFFLAAAALMVALSITAVATTSPTVNAVICIALCCAALVAFLRSRRALSACLWLLSMFAGLFTAHGLGSYTAVATAVVMASVLTALRSAYVRWETYDADVALTTAAQESVDLHRVVSATALIGSMSALILEDLKTAAKCRVVVPGRYHRGDYVAIDPLYPETPLCSATERGMQRALKLRGRMS